MGELAKTEQATRLAKTEQARRTALSRLEFTIRRIGDVLEPDVRYALADLTEDIETYVAAALEARLGSMWAHALQEARQNASGVEIAGAALRRIGQG